MFDSSEQWRVLRSRQRVEKRDTTHFSGPSRRNSKRDSFRAVISSYSEPAWSLFPYPMLSWSQKGVGSARIDALTIVMEPSTDRSKICTWYDMIGIPHYFSEAQSLSTLSIALSIRFSILEVVRFRSLGKMVSNPSQPTEIPGEGNIQSPASRKVNSGKLGWRILEAISQHQHPGKSTEIRQKAYNRIV